MLVKGWKPNSGIVWVDDWTGVVGLDAKKGAAHEKDRANLVKVVTLLWLLLLLA